MVYDSSGQDNIKIKCPIDTSCEGGVCRLPDFVILNILGEQIVIKSKFAFSKIRYEGFEVAEKDMYYVLRKARNDEANQNYLDILEEESDGLYIQDIIRGGVLNDDPRIPRNIS